MIVSPAWSGKKFAVLGLARSGKATVEALLSAGADVLAWDTKPEAREPFAGCAVLADPLEADLRGYAGVVVSPGVPLNTHPIAGHAAKFGVPVIGDIELFAQARAHLPPHKVIGITGTNGKSTTTALVHHILNTAGAPTTMGGNIGLPILEQEPLPAGGVYVLELSSYQIDLTHSLACEAAALLNITPDHLDRYGGFGEYAASKARLFAMQGSASFALFGSDDPMTMAAYEALRSRRPEGQARRVEPKATVALQPTWPALQGPHNLANAAMAVALAETMGVCRAICEDALCSFAGLPHRMERVESLGDVLYVNDSKGTNTAATAPALAAFVNIHWIVGGLAKEPGLGECEAQLGHVKAAYTIGSAGPQFAALLEPGVPVTRSEKLERAVRDAAAAAEAGDVVLLSPACASFDQFADFEARGEAFRAAVLELTA